VFRLLKLVDALETALPRLLGAFNAVLAALEYLVLRLTLLWFLFYGIYKAVSSH